MQQGMASAAEQGSIQRSENYPSNRTRNKKHNATTKEPRKIVVTISGAFPKS
jgi:hypothetical protein